MFQKSYFYFFLFLFTSFVSFTDGWQNQEERIAALNQEITQLMKKKQEYEVLKQKIRSEVTKENPKIALVLSGGGAKGAAHIGVLKVLEKYQIPVDIIIGTSVGSIVGGMYAIGYSPEEIETLILNLNFGKLLTDSKDKTLKTIESHLTNEKYPLHFNMDKEFNISTPMGILNGQNIYFQLKDIFSPAENIHNFDEFPIPYRAITTNLQNGKEEIIKEGNLALASFQSMAIPAFISPVEHNGEFFVDGGVVNNFPVDVAIQMGADIIIGVDISADDNKISNDSNIISILDKISSYNGNRSTELHRQLANILIVPNVKQHNTVDFSNLSNLIQEGEIAAEKHANILQKFTNSSEFQKKKMKKLQQKSFYIEKIKCHGNEILSLEEIVQLAPPSKTKRYSKEQLEEWARKIYANTYVDKVEYHIKDNILYFNIHEKKEIILNAGLAYHTHYGGSFNVAANIPNFFDNITTHLGLKAEISEFPKLDIHNSFQYRIQRQTFYGQGRIFFQKSPFFLYEAGDNISTYATMDIGTSFTLGTELSPSLMLQYELSHHNINHNYVKGKRKIKEIEQNYKILKNTLKVTKDTLNRNVFSNKGYKLEGEISNMNSTDSHKISASSLKGTAEIYIPITDTNLTFSSALSGGKISGRNIPKTEYIKIGGSRNFQNNVEFLGVPISSIHSNHFWLWNFGLQYKLFENLNFIGKYNHIEYSNEKNEKQKEDGYGFGLGFDIFYTPITFQISKRRHYRYPVWELSLGYAF